MNLISHLKELWHRRVLVGLSIAFSAAIAILLVFQVSLSPPSISKRNHVDAKGSIEILIDSSRSPLADSRRDLSGLTARAGVFARLMTGGTVVGRIAKTVGIPVNQIDVAGPAPLPGEAPGAAQAPLQIHPYGIAIAQVEELPIVSVETRAPTVREARALAAAAPGAIRHLVDSIQAQQETPEAKRVELRVLGPAQAAPKDEAAGKKMALALFVFLVVLSIVLILAVPRLVEAWRSTPPASGAPDRLQGVPEILPLPAGPTGEADGEADPGATRIGRGEP